MSQKRPGIKGKSRKARDKAFARREQLERERKKRLKPAESTKGFPPHPNDSRGDVL